MKKLSLIALFAAAALALASSAAFAQHGSLISVGVEFDGNSSQSHVYFYGEVGLSPVLVGAFEFANDHPLVAGLWYGAGRGFYGEVELAVNGGDTNPVIEAGVWGSWPLSSTVGLTGWVGAQTNLGNVSNLRVTGGAEVEIPLAQSFALFVGADATLLQDPTETSAWVGVGLYF